MNLDILSNIIMNHNDRASINYSKARAAIEGAAKDQLKKADELQKGNAARANNMRKEAHRFVIDAKVVVIGHLGGKVFPDPKLNRRVEFNDGTKARY